MAGQRRRRQPRGRRTNRPDPGSTTPGDASDRPPRTKCLDRDLRVPTRGGRPRLGDREQPGLRGSSGAGRLDARRRDRTGRRAWFDAEGFRLHHRNERLAAFCWTKIHVDRRPPIGEIYVVAVDPDFQGTGLGEEIVLAGLDAITARGVTTATLFVDGSNAAAIRLYDRLGFTVHRVRTACSGLQPDSSST
ncbi:MAG: GNAT family N-acetyltransferase [Ilumatobacteraceae bacterium]